MITATHWFRLAVLPSALVVLSTAALAGNAPNQPSRSPSTARPAPAPSQQNLDLEMAKARQPVSAQTPAQLPGHNYTAYARLPFQKNITRVNYRVSKSGYAVFEGDMVLGKVAEVQSRSSDYEKLLKADNLPMSLATADFASLWPGGVVPYHISEDFGDQTIAAIKSAVDTLNAKTQVRFVPYDKTAHKDYVDIVVMDEDEGGSGQSEIGRQSGRQKLWLKTSVDSSNTIVHELMHSLGFRHEHTRADRDRFVQILWGNIQDGEDGNFRIHDGDFLFDSYDKASVMHYNGFAFSKSCNLVLLGGGTACGVCPDLKSFYDEQGKCWPTIIDKATGDPFEKVGPLSTGDIAAINALYPPDVAGTTLPPINQLRSLRTTIERVITRAGPGESGLCGRNTDYVATITAGPMVDVPGLIENAFAGSAANVWENDKPERSNDLRPANWRLVTPIGPNTRLMRVDIYLHDHDDALCGGKDEVVDINPTSAAYLRLQVDTQTGDVNYLSREDSVMVGQYTYPLGSRIGAIFDPKEGKFVTLTFNGLLDGAVDYDDEAEVQIKIEIL